MVRTWQDFLESKDPHSKKNLFKAVEKAEEETGVDWDHDDEKGEPEKHKDKVKKAKSKKKC